MLERIRLLVPRPRRPSAGGLALAAGGLAIATVLAFVLVRWLGVPDAAVVYLLPVLAVGMAEGTWLAVATSVASFLIYDFLFVTPLYTFSIQSSEEWLNLLLFLVVTLVIGRLSALQLERRREAELRTSEARAMFAMSRDIASAASLLEAAPGAVTRLAREGDMERVWIGLGRTVGGERIVADSKPGEPRPPTGLRWVLHATSAEVQPTWSKVHDAALQRDHHADDCTVFRVPIVAGGEAIGSIWATRGPGAPFPGRSHSRLLAASADQLAQAVIRDRLAAEATAAEVAREGDALKTALLDSVSHDLRTPLNAIRAAAGNLMDSEVELTPEQRRTTAVSIDLEAQRLSRLVRNMLDLSRIEGGALHPSLELYELADLVDPVVERVRPTLGTSPVTVDVPDLPAVKADALFVDQIVTNLLENAARYAPGSAIRVSAAAVDDHVELVVEDAGPGVPDDQMPRLFDRFYRAARRADGRADGGSGIGLTVVKGLAEAMGGSVDARPSELGGLAVAVRLECESVDGSEPELPAEVRPEVEPAGAAEPAVELPAPDEPRLPAESPAPDEPRLPAELRRQPKPSSSPVDSE